MSNKRITQKEILMFEKHQDQIGKVDSFIQTKIIDGKCFYGFKMSNGESVFTSSQRITASIRSMIIENPCLLDEIKKLNQELEKERADFDRLADTKQGRINDYNNF